MAGLWRADLCCLALLIPDIHIDLWVQTKVKSLRWKWHNVSLPVGLFLLFSGHILVLLVLAALIYCKCVCMFYCFLASYSVLGDS